MDRRAAGALLALAACIACSAAAPTASNQTALDLYEGASEGCYYNFQHYGEGDRIMTNEPCLNCTCHNRMLMCYLRVCPFTKAIGQDCTVEKRADQCCPIVTCPDVPVDLLTSTSTTSPAEYGATGIGKLDKYGCSISGKYFPEGSKVPPTPNKPCEHCYCIRNMTTCVMQECTLHVDGCTPIYHKDVCCPVRYSCDHPEDEMPLLDDMSTTVRPTPGFLLTTTTISPVTQMTQDCVHDDQIFADGALIKTEKACEHCYCMKGDIVCVVQECGAPMENEGKNCTSLPPREGQCCPDTYICEGDELSSEFPTDSTTESVLEKLTTLTPPRRAGVEGSGYRNEPDEAAYTEIPTIESEVEGSGEEQETSKPLDPNEIIPVSEDGDQYIYVTTKAPTFEEHEQTTTEFDKNVILDLDDKTVDPHVYLSTTNAPVSEEIEKLTSSGITEVDILEPHKHVPTTSAPESYEKATTELGESLNTVPDVIPEEEVAKPHEHAPSTTSAPAIEESGSISPIEGEEVEPTSSEKEQEEYSKPEQSTPSSISYNEIEKETTTPAEASKSPEVITDKDFTKADSDITGITNAPVIGETETSAPPIGEDENESSQPEQFAPSTTSSPIEDGEKFTTEPDHAQNTVAVAEDESAHPHLHIPTTTIGLPSVEEERTTVSNLEQNIVTDKDMKDNVLTPHEHVPTVAADLEEDKVTTAEPDRGLNTIPNEINEESSSEPSLPGRTTVLVETKATESSITSEDMQTQEVDIKPTTVSETATLLPDSIVTKGDQYTITTEPSFRKEDESSVSSEKTQEFEPTTVKSEFVDEGLIPTSEHDERFGTGPDGPSTEEDLTTSVPEYTKEMAETTGSKQTTTESILVTSVVTESLPGKSTVPTPERDGELSSSTEKSADVTSFAQENVETHEEPSRIPGEGDCLLNGVTYRNNTVVPSTNNCHTGCRCASSIIKCDPIICSPPPDYMDNCQSIYDSPDSCCPTYVCDHPRETVPPQSDNQMSGTESPMPSPTIECRGDQCEISEPAKQPTGPPVLCTSGSCLTEADHKPEIECGSEGCGDVSKKPDTSLPSEEQAEECTDGKCKPESCANGECQSPQTEGQVSPIKPCEGEHCEKVDEVIFSPSPQLCTNEEDCKSMQIPVAQATPCEGESCKKIDCENGGCDSDVVSTPQDTHLVSCKDEDGCKPQDISVEDCTGDEPCRRKEISPSDEKMPTECEGSNCKHDMETTIAQEGNLSTESPVPDQTPSGEVTDKITVITEEEKATELPESHITTLDDKEKTPVKDAQEKDTYTTESQTTAAITEANIQKEKPVIEDVATTKPTVIIEEGTDVPTIIDEADKDKLAVVGEITEKPASIEKEVTETPAVIEGETDEPAMVGEEDKEKPAMVEDKITEKPTVVEEQGTEQPALVGDDGKEKPTVETETTKKPLIIDGEGTELPSMVGEKDTEKPAIIDEEAKDKPVVVDEDGIKKPATVEEEGTKQPAVIEDEGMTKPAISEKESTDKPAITDEEGTEEPAIIEKEVTKIPDIVEEEGTEKPLIDEEGKDKPAVVEEEGTEKPAVVEEGTEKPLMVAEEGKDKPAIIDEERTDKPALVDEEDTEAPVQEINTEKPAVIEIEGTDKPAMIGEDVEDKPAVSEEKTTDKPDVAEEAGNAKPVLTGETDKKQPAGGEEESTEKLTVIDELDTEKTMVIDEEAEEKPAVIEGDGKEKPALTDEEGAEKPVPEEDAEKKPAVVKQEGTENPAMVDEAEPGITTEIDEEHKEKPTVDAEEVTTKPALVDEEKSSESPAVTIEEGSEAPAIIVEKDTEKPTILGEDGKEELSAVEKEGTMKPIVMEIEGTGLPTVVGEENTEKPSLIDEEGKDKPTIIEKEGTEEPAIVEEGTDKPTIGEAAVEEGEEGKDKPAKGDEESIKEEEGTRKPAITEEETTTKSAISDEKGTEEPVIVEKEGTVAPAVIEREGTEEPAIIGGEDTEKPAIIDEEAKDKPVVVDEEGIKTPIIIEEEGTKKPAVTEDESTAKSTISETDSTDKPATTEEEGTEEPAIIEKEVTEIPDIVEEGGTDKPVLIDEEDKVEPSVEENIVKPAPGEEEGTKKPVEVEEEGTDKPTIIDEEVKDKPTVIDVESTEEPQIHEEEGSGTELPDVNATQPEKEIKLPEEQPTESTVTELEKITKRPIYESQTTLAKDDEYAYSTESSIVESIDVSTLPQESMTSQTPEIKVTETKDSDNEVPVIIDHSHTPEITTEALKEQESSTKTPLSATISEEALTFVPEREKETVIVSTVTESYIEVTSPKVDTTDIKEEASTLGQDLTIDEATLSTKVPELHETTESVEKTTEPGSIGEQEEVFTDISELESPTTKAPELGPVIIEPQEGIEPELPVTTKTEEESTTKVYEEEKIKPVPESHVTEVTSASPEQPETSDRVPEVPKPADEDKPKPELPELTEPEKMATQSPVDVVEEEIKTPHPEIYSPDKEETITETPGYFVTEPVRRFTEIEDPFVTGQDTTGYPEQSTENRIPSATEKIDEILETSTSSSEKPMLTDMESTNLPEQTSESDKPTVGVQEQSPQTQDAEKEKPDIFETPSTDIPISIVTESQEVTHATEKDVTRYDEKTTNLPDLSDQTQKGTTPPEGDTKEQEASTEIPQHHVTTSEELSKATESYITEQHITEPQESSTKSGEQEEIDTQSITTEVPRTSVKEGEAETKAPEVLYTNLHDLDEKEPSVTEIPKQSTELSSPSEDVQTETPGVQVTSEAPQSLVTEHQEPFGEEATVSSIPKDESSHKPESLTTQVEEITKTPDLRVPEQEEIRTETPVHITESVEVSKPEITDQQDKTTKLPEEAVTEQQDTATTLRETPAVPQEVITAKPEADTNLPEITTVKQIEEFMKSTEHTQTEFSETTPYLIELEEHTHKNEEDMTSVSPSEEAQTEKPEEDISTSSPPAQEYTHKIEELLTTALPFDEKRTTVHPDIGQEPLGTEITTKVTDESVETATKEAEATSRPGEESSPENVPEKISESVPIKDTTPAAVQDLDNKYSGDNKDYTTSAPTQTTEEYTPPVVTESEKLPISESDIAVPIEKETSITERPEDEFIFSTTKATTLRQEEEILTPVSDDKFTKPEEKPSEASEVSLSSTTTEIPKPGVSDMQPTDEIPAPEEEGHFPPSGPNGYGEPDYVEEDQAFGPGTCRYGGKVYVSAQQIPRDDPCDFCFCFRSDIICLQQSCPPPIHGCHEEPIQGFCCPRYECPVSMATTVNVTTTTTTTTTTLPPHFPTHSYKGAAQRRGCQIKGHSYKVGEVVRSSSGPCLHCTCGGDGQMKCDPKACTPEPMLRQMIAAAVSAKRRR